jgi:4-hydroxy-3-methylbut-2-enyl diphosphate reductase IspH
MGFGYFSLSRYLKYKVKKAVDFVFKFEENLANYCKKRGFDGVICGHIHHAEIKEINGVTYMNDGDWVESCTALVEHWDGRWEIITWTREKDNVDTDNIGSSYKRLKRRAGASGTDVSGSSLMRTKSTNNDLLVKV